MAEGQVLFSLELDRFREALDSSHWFRLQHEFETKSVTLSKSLLVWSEESGRTWLLTDFENKKTYDIKMVDDPAGNHTVDVSEQPSDAEHPFTLENTATILDRLRSAQGTDQGFIDLLKRLDLDELDLEGLKRSDLSGAGFSFEVVHEDLLIVHGMLREILTASHEWILNYHQGVVRDVIIGHLQQFYENAREIEEFEISGENPRETHDALLKQISDFCDSAKEPLRHIVTYLSSRKLEQLGDEIRVSSRILLDRLNAETDSVKAKSDEAEQKLEEMQQEFDRLKLQMQNQLAEKSISQYEEIFAEQAEQHRKGARIWLGMAGGATVVFFGLFYVLLKWPASLGLPEAGGSGLTGALQSLFIKGFLLSPIYLWLNRSIKNYTAQKHLEVVNTHRQKALETFDPFVAAAEGNRETRDAVLLAATDAIFDANQSGYLSAKASSSDSRSPVQQVIREIIPERSPTKDS